MPLFKGKSSKATPKKVIDYVTSPKKAAIVSSLSLDDNRGYARQFKETCDLYGKGSGHNERKYYHFKLSIDRADNPTPQQSHELAEKLALKLFAAHECVIATHSDTDTVHTHIIINAVSFETGRKLHLNIKDYRDCKDLADTMGAEMGFTELDWRTKTSKKYERIYEGDAPTNEDKYLSTAERNMAKQGNLAKDSWKEALRQAIDEAKAQATTRAEFQRYLADNFGVTMTRNTAKTVTYVHPAIGETHAVRGAKLGNGYAAAAIDQALQANKERRAHNARLLIDEEQTTGPAAASAGANATGTSTVPHNTAIPIQPTSQTGNGERIAPRSLGDVGAELRSLNNAVQSIAGKHQPNRKPMDSVVENGTSEKPTATAKTVEHERSVQQKPKRRSNSHER
jgi:hypothetical protein